MEVIALLISKGADPIQFAAEIGATRWIRFLKKFRANVNPVDEEGNTPLIKACMNLKEYVAGALIECGAIVNAQNK